MSKMDKQLKIDSILIIDSYDNLIAGCDSACSELDLIELINSLPSRHVLMVNRDLELPLTAEFMRGIKQ